MNREMRRLKEKNGRSKKPVDVAHMKRVIAKAKASGWDRSKIPNRIVPADISASLVLKTAVVGEVLSDYLSAINDSGKLAPFSKEVFAGHIEDLKLGEQSQVTNLRMYFGLMRMACEMVSNPDADYYKTLSKLHEHLQMAAAFYKTDESQRAKPFEGSDEELDAEISELRAQLAQREDV